MGEPEATDHGRLTSRLATKVIVVALGVVLALIAAVAMGGALLGSHIPLRELKIDRSFVMEMEHSSDDAVIVRSTVELARNLGLRVIAEGVETRETWNELVSFGCDGAQGFYLSRPLPAEALDEWLSAHEAQSRV